MVFDTVEEAVADIKTGKLVVVVDDEDRENEGDLVGAASLVTPEMVNFMATEARGLVCAPLTVELAERFDFWSIAGPRLDMNKCNFTVSVDYKHGTSTGISAFDRSKTIKALCDDSTTVDDFHKPGHIFPIRVHRGGVLARAGHSEAAVDLAKLAGLPPVGVICEIIKYDGGMARVPDLIEFARKFDLKLITIKDLIQFRRRAEKSVTLEARTDLVTEFGLFEMYVYVSKYDGLEHVALVKGNIDSKKTTLVRVHSECLTGDVFSSRRCDCGLQLKVAMGKIQEAEAGVLLYMRQEGRGIGLVNKVRAYSLQDEGYDTVEANRMLGFRDDLREYGVGAQILHGLGVRSMRLMTNNPRKLVGLEGYGLRILDRVPIEIEPNTTNVNYLRAKKRRLGHLLEGV